MRRLGLTSRNAKLAKGILEQNRAALSRAITLVESTRADHAEQAKLLIDTVLEGRPGGTMEPNTIRLGIAGPPGAGKSTFY